ncbi:MAG: hypothetical protein ACXABY_17335, partial [Candidatus Thorarchaeota archaeon]
MNTYTTTEGLVVEIAPVSTYKREKAHEGIEKKFRDAGEPLDPPRYLIESDAGDTWADYDQDAIKEGTPEEKEAWDAHIDALARMNAEKGEFDTRMVLLDGIKTRPENDEWEKDHAEDYIEVPENEKEKQQHWLLTEVLKTPDDLMGIITQVWILSASGGVSEEDIRAAEKTFQDSLQEIRTSVRE